MATKKKQTKKARRTPLIPTITVAPVEGAKFPRHDNPRRYIDGEMEVPAIGYYTRGVKSGSLRLVGKSTSKPTIPKNNKPDAGEEK